MKFPQKIPGFRWLLAVWAVYTAVWISLEGTLWRVVLMGMATTILIVGYWVQRTVGGKTVSRGVGLLVTAVSGLILGAGSGLLSFVFMAVKTGLHAHGPEFSQAEVAWVWNQLPLGTAVGLLIGVGVGLIWAGNRRSN